MNANNALTALFRSAPLTSSLLSRFLLYSSGVVGSFSSLVIAYSGSLYLSFKSGVSPVLHNRLLTVDLSATPLQTPSLRNYSMFFLNWMPPVSLTSLAFFSS